MFSILKAYGLPDEMIQAVKLLYPKHTKVLSLDGETDEFDILASVLQGIPLHHTCLPL